MRTPGTSPAPYAPSRSSSTATRSPPALPRPASPGSTTTSGTATAPTRSSNSASAVWLALAATSTLQKTPQEPNSLKPKATCRGWPSRSRSPRTNKPLSPTVRPRSTNSSADSPIPRLRPGQHPGRSRHPAQLNSYRSSASDRAKQCKLDKSDSAEESFIRRALSRACRLPVRAESVEDEREHVGCPVLGAGRGAPQCAGELEEVAWVGVRADTSVLLAGVE